MYSSHIEVVPSFISHCLMACHIISGTALLHVTCAVPETECLHTRGSHNTPTLSKQGLLFFLKQALAQFLTREPCS